jgi:hypothetical protein
MKTSFKVLDFRACLWTHAAHSTMAFSYFMSPGSATRSLRTGGPVVLRKPWNGITIRNTKTGTLWSWAQEDYETLCLLINATTHSTPTYLHICMCVSLPVYLTNRIITKHNSCTNGVNEEPQGPWIHVFRLPLCHSFVERVSHDTPRITRPPTNRRRNSYCMAHTQHLHLLTSHSNSSPTSCW